MYKFPMTFLWLWWSNIWPAMLTVPRKSAKVWNGNWMHWCGMNCMQNIRLRPAQKNGNKPVSNTWTSAGYSRISDGETLLIIFSCRQGQERGTLLFLLAEGKRRTLFQGVPYQQKGCAIHAPPCLETGGRVQIKSVRRTRSHRMKFCVQKELGGAALNKQTAGNVSVYKHSHCLPDLCVAIHTHCLPVAKTTETALVPLRKINRNLSIGR